MANHGPVYGLDAELQAKRMASYDPALENEARSYIQQKTGMNMSGDFHEALKDGVALCNLARACGLKCPAPSTSKMPFKMMENINAYLDACKQAGIATHDLFQTVDLYEAKNMNQVVTNILQFKRKFP